MSRLLFLCFKAMSNHCEALRTVRELAKTHES